MSALVLLSGGLDSTVAAALLASRGESVDLGLFVDYGQRAACREETSAVAVGRALGFEVLCTGLPFLGQLSSGSALVRRDRELPSPEEAELSGPVAQASADAVWVPNRNGILVNLAAGVAESRGLDSVIVGFNREEAATFPDNSPAFVEALNRSLDSSTRGRVKVVAPLLDLDKAALLAAGRAVGAPVELSWSCYEGGERPCGRCESCRRRSRAEAALGEPA